MRKVIDRVDEKTSSIPQESLHIPLFLGYKPQQVQSLNKSCTKEKKKKLKVANASQTKQ